MSFAVIETGGKQYLIKPGDKLKIEKIKSSPEGKIFDFDKVLLLVKDEKIEIGKPYLKTKIKAEYIGEGRGKKVVIRKFKSKTRYRKTQGHRQPFSEILVKDL